MKLKFLILLFLIPVLSHSRNDKSKIKNPYKINIQRKACNYFLNSDSNHAYIENYKYTTGDFDPSKAWQELGLETKEIHLEFISEKSFDDIEDVLTLNVLYEGITIMRLDITKSKVIENTWRTSLSLIMLDRYRGKGVGFLTYLLAASKFFELNPGHVLLSSTHQSTYAKKVWNRLVENNYALKTGEVVNPDEEIFGPYIFNSDHLGPKIKDYIRQFEVMSFDKK